MDSSSNHDKVLHASVQQKTKCLIWYTKANTDLQVLPEYQSIYPFVPRFPGAFIAESYRLEST